MEGRGRQPPPPNTRVVQRGWEDMEKERMKEEDSKNIAKQTKKKTGQHLLSHIPAAVWDAVCRDWRLTGTGVAVIDLLPHHHQHHQSSSQQQQQSENGQRMDSFVRSSNSQTAAQDVMARAFSLTRDIFPVLDTCVSCQIPPDATAAHATGYHPAGSVTSTATATGNPLSRYNDYRKGIVFSDGNTLSLNDLPLNNNNNNNINSPPSPPTRNSLTAQQQQQHQQQQEAANGAPAAWLDLEELLHEIAFHVLEALERDLQLPFTGYLESQLGPTRTSSQWHLKEYVSSSSSTKEEENKDQQLQQQQTKMQQTENESSVDGSFDFSKEETKKESPPPQRIALASHTDPSLFSVILHDRPGIQSGALGLQYQIPRGRRRRRDLVQNTPNDDDDDTAETTTTTTTTEPNQTAEDEQRADVVDVTIKEGEKGTAGEEWIEVDRSGHGAAILVVGSVLSYLTQQYYPACRHRVVAETDNNNNTPTTTTTTQPRMAATLFVRPAPTARLVVPLPSPVLQNQQHNQAEHQKTLTTTTNGQDDSDRQSSSTQEQQQQQQQKQQHTKSNKTKNKPVLTFEQWNARVSRNYQKAKAIQNNNKSAK